MSFRIVHLTVEDGRASTYREQALEVEPYIIFLPAEQKGAPPAVSEEVARALRAPVFVSIVERMAAAYWHSPRKFEAMETVISVLLGGDLTPRG